MSATISVIVATYDWPDALDVVLHALSEQKDPPFEVIVADDGSGVETSEVVHAWLSVFGNRLRHVWQVDSGYRRARVLDLAALEARGDFLVFIDGDCVPRRGFAEAVRRAAIPGWFLASKRLHLSPGLSTRVLAERLPVWGWSAGRWLVGQPREFLEPPRQANRAGVLLPLRDHRRPWRPAQREFSPPYDSYGFFLGISRHDFECVNGFDTRFEGWGGEDRDIADRLRRRGLRCGWPGPRVTMLHLWHETPTSRPRPNAALLRKTQTSDRIEAVEGLRQLEAQADESRFRIL